MKCCVQFCKNSSTTVSKLSNITFQTFPTTQILRSSWLAALGVEESRLSNTPVVCSQHFQNDDFSVSASGFRELRSNAVPSVVQFCITCLDTTSKMFPFRECNFEEAYKNVTGLSLSEEFNFAPMLCTECSQRLLNCNRFRDKSLRAHSLLTQLVKKEELLTIENLKKIYRLNNRLTYNTGMKTCESDHSNLHLMENKEVHKNMESNYAEDSVKIEYNPTEKVEVKYEEKDNLVLVLEPKVEALKYDNESDEEFLNDDIDNDVEFMNNRDFDKVKFTDVDSDKDVQIVNNTNDNVFIKNDSYNEFVNDDRTINDVALNENRNNMDVFDKDYDMEVLDETDVHAEEIHETNGKVKKVKPRNVTRKSISRGCSKPRKIKKSASNNGIKLFKVSVLTYEEQLAELHKRQQTKNYKTSPFKCGVCFKGYNDRDAYSGHMVKHTDAFGQFECAICGLHSKSRNALRIHIVCNHSSRYSCTSCPFITMYKNSAALHERWHKGIKYKCPKCEEQFSKSTSFINHLRIKHPSDFACTHCGYSFVSQKGLQQHTRMKHRFEDPLLRTANPEGPVCEPCNVRFASEAAYSLHMRISPKHTGVGELKRNEPYGVTKPKVKSDSVDECEPITCEQCGIQLRDFRMYTNHFNRNHPDKNRTKYPPGKSAAMCELCGRVFKSEALFRWHMPCTMSAAQKQFKCDVCEKTFRLKMQLAAHKKIHSDTRPTYDCPVCGKSFTTRGNRWRHLLIHSGIKFPCEVCDKTFTSEPERRSHVAHVHLKVPWPKRKRVAGPKARQPARAKDEPAEPDV